MGWWTVTALWITKIMQHQEGQSILRCYRSTGAIKKNLLVQDLNSRFNMERGHCLIDHIRGQALVAVLRLGFGLLSQFKIFTYIAITRMDKTNSYNWNDCCWMWFESALQNNMHHLSYLCTHNSSMDTVQYIVTHVSLRTKFRLSVNLDKFDSLQGSSDLATTTTSSMVMWG